jgi:hypothetical protein
LFARGFSPRVVRYKSPYETNNPEKPHVHHGTHKHHNSHAPTRSAMLAQRKLEAQAPQRQVEAQMKRVHMPKCVPAVADSYRGGLAINRKPNMGVDRRWNHQERAAHGIMSAAEVAMVGMETTHNAGENNFHAGGEGAWMATRF